MDLFDIKNSFIEGHLSKPEYIDKMFDIHSVLFDYAGFLKSTDISKIEITEQEEVIMTFKSSGVKMVCSSNDKRLAPFDALNFGSYEQSELQMQIQLMEPGYSIIDIGGNYGWYAMHMAYHFPAAKILSFEPIPYTFEQLKKNIKKNNFKNIETFDYGFSDIPGSFSFYYDPALSANASLKNVSGTKTIQEIKCKVTTLDEFCTSHKLTVDLIKCDVEGAELLAFRGGRNIISRNLPIIFSEMLRKWTHKFDYHPNDIIQFLSDLGYQCYTLDKNRLRVFETVTEETLETNYFFLHPIKHSKKIKDFSLK